MAGGAGQDTLEGGAGADTADYSHDKAAGGGAGVTVTLDASGNGTAVDGFGDTDTLRSIENATGTSSNDTFNLSAPAGHVIDGVSGESDTVHYGSGVVWDRNTGEVWDSRGQTHDSLQNIDKVSFNAGTVIPDFGQDNFVACPAKPPGRSDECLHVRRRMAA